MKTVCPRCGTEDNARWSDQPQDYKCLCCGHGYVIPPGPKLEPLPDVYRVCENCCDLLVSKEKSGMASGCLISLIILFFGAGAGWLLFGIAGEIAGFGLMIAYVVLHVTQKDHVCPKCGAANMISKDSPKGLEIISKYGLKDYVDPD